MTTSTASVLFRPAPGSGLVVASRRRRDVLRAHLFGWSLDRRLAAGEAPESDRSLAVRAGLITGTRARRRLAQHLADLPRHARRLSVHSAMPVSRSVLAAQAELNELVAALRRPVPVPAGTVAQVRRLLTDGSSPVYSPRTDLRDVFGRLAEAVGDLRQSSPSTSGSVWTTSPSQDSCRP